MYRKPVEVLNPGGTALTSFQVKVTLDEPVDFGKTNAGGSDIRFASSSGTEIPYWIESWDDVNTLATIWVKVPNIPVSGTTIYMYYGNSIATSASNGTATFKFFR